MRKFKTWRDPYGNGYSTCRPAEITIIEGLTVLVGCNGAGKTTLLHNIEESLHKDKIPVKMFNNLDGGGFSADYFFFNGDSAMGAALLTSSEGESIRLRVGEHASKIFNFLKTGKYRKDDRMEALADTFRSFGNAEEKKEEKLSNERWLLFDATDSGYSVDNIIELKDLFKLMFEDAKKFHAELYIVIAANEYELANGEDCFDVNRGKYIRFSDYSDYRKFILDSRKRKEQRIERAAQKEEKKKHNGEKIGTNHVS